MRTGEAVARSAGCIAKDGERQRRRAEQAGITSQTGIGDPDVLAHVHEAMLRHLLFGRPEQEFTQRRHATADYDHLRVEDIDERAHRAAKGASRAVED